LDRYAVQSKKRERELGGKGWEAGRGKEACHDKYRTIRNATKRKRCYIHFNEPEIPSRFSGNVEIEVNG
jgi:hypothetical protein